MEGVSKTVTRGIVLLRVVLGFGFLYAGLEKALNFAGDDQPWSAAGFLKFATAGTVPNMVGHPDTMVHNPTRSLWVDLAGNSAVIDLVNALVVVGEITIGAALIIGLATRLAGTLGAVMMVLFWLAAWDFQYGVVNIQLLYAAVSGFLAYVHAGRYFGLDGILERSDVIRRTPALRFVG